MKAKIITTFIGCFGIDKNDEVVEYVKFSNNPVKISEKIIESKSGYIEEERTIEDFLKKKGFKDISKGTSREISSNLPKLAIQYKFVKNLVEFNRLVSETNIEMTKADIKKAIGKDKIVIQVSGAIDELDKSINILIERLREWYGLHFPEMDRIIRSNEKYADIVGNFGSRKNIEHPDLSYYREKSMGMELNKNDSEIVKKFANEIIELYAIRNRISKYADGLLNEVAPNTVDIAGPVLTAKLIALAGGLNKLSRMPSSTIQLLGAEKALFRHLKGKGKSPKHGIILMHPFVQRAPAQVRGKIARTIASKISIASKIDFFSKDYRGNELKKSLEDKVKEIVSRSRETGKRSSK